MPVNKKEALDRYRSKRSRDTTPEPFGDSKTSRPGAFVVQQHDARRLHFDLRLECNNVLWSWAVPKGFSLDPREKRLAVRTEDHPLEYIDFEGVIPEGSYGAGAMIVWDRGQWIAIEDPQDGMQKGKLLFDLHGHKLRGRWTLVRTKKNESEWLLIKKPDHWAKSDEKIKFPQDSVLSGLTVTELGQNLDKEGTVRRQAVELGAVPARFSSDGVELMLAQTRDRVKNRKGWIYELKYDGYRALAERQGPRVKIRYRSGLDATGLYPEITRTLAALPFDSLILDGELVVLDEQGKPNFQLLQQRGRSSQDPGLACLQPPVTLFAFDVLHVDDLDLRPLRLTDRKALLRDVLPTVGTIRFVEHYGDGEALFAQVQHFGFEGVVGKKAASPYRSGRHCDWEKVHADRTASFVVVGFTEARGGRTGFGALHLAGFRGDQLHYAGRVGSGFSESQLAELRQALEKHVRNTAPCAGAPVESKTTTWTEPHFVCRVRFKEFTQEGLLRQPRFLEWQPDLPPEDCTLGPKSEPSESAERPKRRQATDPKVRFSNLDKVFWPEEGYTKGDLIDYYRAVSDSILPYLQDRPLVLDRYPDGIDGKSFFQKNAPEATPDWIRTEQIWSQGATAGNSYFVCDRQESLLHVANLAAIPLHVWASRIATLSRPDWCVLDLDPKGALFSHVIEIARFIHRLCRSIEIDCFVKTSGGDGLHVLLPMRHLYGFSQAKLLAEVIARITVRRLPEIATVERNIEARQGRVYVDYVQNGEGKLIAAPFCVRPRLGAPVSTPLSWKEVKEGLDPARFTIQTVPRRVKRQKQDPLAGVLTAGLDLPAALERLQKLLDTRD